MKQKIQIDNFLHSYLRFNDRQAGVSAVFCPNEKKFFYNAYCIDMKILKELMSIEFEYIEDAIELINDEFSTWEFVDFEPEKSCGSCAAK